MLERHLAGLLATHLSRFIENVNEAQLQVSLWSGDVVLHNVQLRSEALERITALLLGEGGGGGGGAPLQSSSGVPSARPQPASSTPNGSAGSTTADASSSTAAMRMLLAPFTIVKGIIRQLVISVPWASLESEQVSVQAIGVELVLGPLRARPFNAWEEQEREQAIKQQQIALYEAERRRLSRATADEEEGETDSVASSLSTTTSARVRRERGGEGGGGEEEEEAASSTSWFSWLWDFDRMSQIVLRNVCVTLQDVSMRYEFDYDGLHPSCASAFSVAVKRVQLTSTDELFKDVFVKDLLAPLCKRAVLSEVAVSIHAVRHRRSGSADVASADGRRGAEERGPAGPAQQVTAASQQVPLSSEVRVAAYDTYAADWAFSEAILRVEELELQMKLVPPGCASKNAIVEDASVLSASSTELTVATVEGVDVNVCFGAVQVLESMWRSYHQSLSCARYRKRLHLLRPGKVPPNGDVAAAEPPQSTAGSSPDLCAAARPTAQQRWQFALRCVLDDVRQQRQTLGLHDRSRREVVEAMVQFAQLRRQYCEYWKRSKGIDWAPPLDLLERRKLELMERQLSLSQVIFLRCLSHAELMVERDGHMRQQAFIEEARRRAKAGARGDNAAAPATGERTASRLWGWFSGARGRAPERESVPAASSAAGSPQAAQSTLSLCDLMDFEWAVGRCYASPHHAPLTQPSVPQNRLPGLAAEKKLYFTMRALFPRVAARLDPTYWPLSYDSSVPATPADTPLRRVTQHLVVQLRALELFYTTVPDERPDKASLSFFLGSAAVGFEGVLRSVLLQSKQQVGEDYVVVKRNAQRTHLGVWVSQQLVVCQPTHEWAWWYAELSAFAQWCAAVQQAFYVAGSGSTAAAAAAAAAAAVTAVGRRTPASTSAPSTPQRQPSHTAAEALTAAAKRSPSTVPLLLNVTMQSLDVCVPLFARDVEASDLEIFYHQPSALSSPVHEASLSGTVAHDSGSRFDKLQRRSRTFSGHGGDSDGADAKSWGEELQGSTAAEGRRHASYLAEDGLRTFDVEEMRHGDGYADSLLSSHPGSLDSFASATPERYFLNNDACLVLSVSATRLCTVPPLTRRYTGSGTEYYLCIGDHRKAVRLFCQRGCHTRPIAASRQLELLSFVAGEVLLNPAELTVLFNKGVDAVADPAALALVNDALLKPAVFCAPGSESDAVRALTAELGRVQAAASTVTVPWRLATAREVVLLRSSDGGSNGDAAAPLVRGVPPDCARHLLTALSPPQPSPSEQPRVGSAFGGRVLTVGMGVARLLIRSDENVDVAEVVLVAPEHLPAATAPYREVLSALGAQEPRAMEFIYNFAGGPQPEAAVVVGERGDGRPLSAAPEDAACPALLLSVADIAMTTAAGRRLLNIENLTLVQACTASSVAEATLTVESVSAVCSVALVQLLEVAVGAVLAVQPMEPPLASARPPTPSRAALAPLPRLTVRVRSTRFQIPLSRDDVEDAPYVEVSASVQDLLCTLDNTDDRTRRVHVCFSVPEAVQLADYIGGDPEARGLLSAYHWAACASGGAPSPLRCTVDVTSSAGSGIACQLSTVGGALHVYCPFLYLYAAAIEKDERLLRLRELTRSPLLHRGYTRVPHTAPLPPNRRDACAPPPPATPAASALLSLEVSIADLDIFLASDVAVPIDMTDPDTLSVVHIDQITGGVRQTSSSRAELGGTSTHVFLDTTNVQLLDLLSSSVRDVRLPNVKVRAELGVLLVPREDLTGYTYQTGAPGDCSVLVGVHPTSLPRAPVAREPANCGGSVASELSEVSLHLSAHQCRSLARFCTSNVAVLPIPSTRRSSNVGGAQPQPQTEHRQRSQPALHSEATAAFELSPSTERTNAPPPTPPPSSSAITLLLTVPAAFLLVDADGYDAVDQDPHRTPTQLSTEKDAEVDDVSRHSAAAAAVPLLRPPRRRVSYEFALRRGAEFYSAVGGRWSAAPVTNGQMSGLELLAREREEDALADAGADAAVEPASAHLLLTVDMVGAALVTPGGDGVSNGGAVGGPPLTEDAGPVVVPVAAAIRKAHLRVPHLRWWTGLYDVFMSVSSRSRSTFRSAARTPLPGGAARSDMIFGDASRGGMDAVSCGSAAPREASRGGCTDEDRVVWAKRQGGAGSAAQPHRPRWLCGTLEVSDTRVSLLTAAGATSCDQQPWCRLTIPEARFMASPRTAPSRTNSGSGSGSTDGGHEPGGTFEEFVCKVPRCPELLLLRATDDVGDGSTAAPRRSPRPSYVSVLRQRRASPAAAPGSAAVAAGKSSSWWGAAASFLRIGGAPQTARGDGAGGLDDGFFSFRLLRSPDADGLGELRYGRSYYVTDLSLHRTAAAQVCVRRILIDLPARALFSFAREVQQQLDETPSRTAARAGDGGETEPPVRTYTGMEMELVGSEVRLSMEAESGGGGGGPVWCSVAVASARLSTAVQLQSILTNAGEPAALIDDGPSGGWRVQIWQLVPRVAVEGLVLSARHVAEVRWALPGLCVSASLPLTRTVICARTNRPIGADDDLDLSASADDSALPALRRRCATDLFQVEPTAATVCDELNLHVLTTVRVDVGNVDALLAGGTTEPRPPLEVHLHTLFTITCAAARLADVWQCTRRQHCELPRQRRRCGSGPLSWYRAELCLHSTEVRVLSLSAAEALASAGDDSAGLRPTCLLRATVTGDLTVQCDRERGDEDTEGGGSALSPLGEQDSGTDAESREEDEHGSCGSGEGEEVVEVRTVVRLLTGAVHLEDGAGNLLLDIRDAELGATPTALTAEYTPADGRLAVSVDHLTLHSSARGVASVVEWWNVCRGWSAQWKHAHRLLTTAAIPVEEDTTATATATTSVEPLRHADVHIRRVEVTMAPVACLDADEVRASYTLGSDGDDGRCASTVGVCCRVARLRSTLPLPGVTAAASDAKDDALAEVASPTLTLTMRGRVREWDLVCRVPQVTLTNRDSHTWAVCAFRVASVVGGSVSACYGSGDVDAAAPQISGSDAVRDAVPSWWAWVPRTNFDVDRVELRCFGPHVGSAAPQVCVKADHIALRFDGEGDSGEATLPHITTEGLRLDASAVFSATYAGAAAHGGTAHELLGGTAVTVALRAPPPSASGALRVSLTLTGAASPPSGGAVCLQVPTGETLAGVVAALALLTRQRLPRQYATADPRVAAAAAVASSGARVSGDGVLWHVRVDVPQVLLHCLVTEPSAAPSVRSLSRLFSLHFVDAHAEVETRRGGVSGDDGDGDGRRPRRRPHIAAWLGSVTGETVVRDDADAMEELVMETPQMFLALRPRAASSRDPHSPRRAFDPAHNAAASIVQQSLPLAAGDDPSGGGGVVGDERTEEGGLGFAAAHGSVDDVTALAVRVHALHVHPSTTLLMMVAERVVRPCVTGAAAADADASGARILACLEEVVLRVGGPSGAAMSAAPPTPAALDRQAGRVRVVEVVADWHLQRDVRLGGEGGLQLYFRGVAGRSVLTVRGGGPAAAVAVPTIFVSCPVSVNGEMYPAIRVDADVTVRFENVRVVFVDADDGASAAAATSLSGGDLDAYVELGERSLCILPPLSASGDREVTETVAGNPAIPVGDDAADAAAAVTLAPPPLQWGVSLFYTVHVSVGFDVSLTTGARHLAAAGVVQARYRFEEKRTSGRPLRSEHEGECSAVLRSCTCESGPVTETPAALTTKLGFTAEENRLKLVLHGGSTAWRLPLGHAQVLLQVGQALHDALRPPAIAPLASRSWQPPAPPPPPRDVGRGRPLPPPATPVDARVDVRSWVLSVTSDTGALLAVLRVDQACLQCTTDTNVADVALTAEATVSLRDCVELVGESGRHGDAAEAASARVLFHAHPCLSLSLIRFSPVSRSLSVSLRVDDVVATLPLVKAARLLRSTVADARAVGRIALCNDTGVDVEVSAMWGSAAVTSTPPPHSATQRWRVGGSHARVVRTGIPVSCSALLVTPVAVPSVASPATGVVVHVGAFTDDAVCRVSLDTFHSALGGLDVIVRRTVCDGVDAVQLATSVVLANVFYAPASGAAGAYGGAAGCSVRVASGTARLVVPPRAARYIPLPLLQSALAVELDGYAYTPVAHMLTWAMLADAMTAMADQAAARPATGGVVYGRPRTHDGAASEVGGHDGGGGGLRAPAVCGRVRALDAFTLTFPMLLQRPARQAPPSTAATPRSLGERDDGGGGGGGGGGSSGSGSGSDTNTSAPLSPPHPPTVGDIGKVVQLTWRRHCSPLAASLFSGRVSPSEYTVAVEPVWTLWNWTGCRLRLRLHASRDGVASAPVTASSAAASPSPSPPQKPPTSTAATGADTVVATADVESGACFQWTPTSLRVLHGTVFAVFQLLAPTPESDMGGGGGGGSFGSISRPSALPPSPEWWRVAAPLSLQEPPPAYMRLQHRSGVTRGAVRVEQHGPSTVVLRCAAFLRSALAQPVYLCDPAAPKPLPGAGADGCVTPGRQLPLFYSEYATTPTLRADRVGFSVCPSAPSPRSTNAAAAAGGRQDNTYYITAPIAATVLTAAVPGECTRFYTVSALSDAPLGTPPASESVPAQSVSCLWSPPPPPTLQLRALCRIRNNDPRRALLAVPWSGTAGSSAAPSATAATVVPPGEEREVSEFSPDAAEPEMRLVYCDTEGQCAAHVWSPPVRLLSLATSTQPLVLKHTCLSGVAAHAPRDGESGEDCFTTAPVPRRAGESTVERFRCLTVQSSTAAASLSVSVGLQAAPPLKLVNRLNTTLEFAQCAIRPDPASASSAAPSSPGTVCTALCSGATAPWSYVVSPGSKSYGCWEVPTLEAPGLRVTLHSNTRKGYTAHVDLDLLECASSPSSGTRVGNTNAYVYVSLDHHTRQFTVTVAPSCLLESRMLFQPRRLTQFEAYVRSCTVYVAAVTVPTTGSLARKSLIALESRGRLRLRRGTGTGAGETVAHDTVPPHATDDDLLSFLMQQELDVVLVRMLGFYGSVTATERHLMGTASLGLLEVVNCTTVEAVNPVVLRIGGVGARAGASAATSSAGATPSTAANSSTTDTTIEAESSLPGGVPHFKDPSWLAVEVQLIRPDRTAAAATGAVMVAVQQLRVSAPPVVLCADDDLLFTLRAAAERVGEELAWLTENPGSALTERRDSFGSLRSEPPTQPALAPPPSPVYHVFLYALRISAVDAVVTYTRTGHRSYSPFKGLGFFAVHLLPSVEGLRLSLKELRMWNVELRASRSLASVAKSFLWPLYRSQLLLQSYKVLGSLDVLGNPQALLGSWSRGVWELVSNSSGRGRWAGTRDLLRTTTSSTLHSVGVLARSIGNLAGASPTAAVVAPTLSSGSAGSNIGGGAVVVSRGRHGVVGEVLREVGGGVSDAVRMPLRGAREHGVAGFFTGIAAGVVGLVGRPVFGFFRGVSVTSEFYARLLGGLGELTQHEAWRLGVERNYLIAPVDEQAAKSTAVARGDDAVVADEAAPRHALSRAALRSGQCILTQTMYEHLLADVPRWRRGDETSVRLAVDRVGVRNTALHAPYAAVCAFLSPDEFRTTLRYSLTALLAGKLDMALGQHRATGSPTRQTGELKGKTGAQGEAERAQMAATQLASECQRAAHIKASLGVSALHTYVTDEVFVRVCSLTEMEKSLMAKEEQERYSLTLARTLSAAAEQLLSP